MLYRNLEMCIYTLDPYDLTDAASGAPLARKSRLSINYRMKIENSKSLPLEVCRYRKYERAVPSSPY